MIPTAAYLSLQYASREQYVKKTIAPADKAQPASAYCTRNTVTMGYLHLKSMAETTTVQTEGSQARPLRHGKCRVHSICSRKREQEPSLKQYSILMKGAARWLGVGRLLTTKTFIIRSLHCSLDLRVQHQSRRHSDEREMHLPTGCSESVQNTGVGRFY